MATLTSKYLDIIDVYKRSHPDGTIADVIMLLNKLSPATKDARVMECNEGTSHIHTVSTSLPTPTWGQLYKGTPQTKGSTAQVKDTTGFLEALSTVDKRLLELTKNPGALRLSEAKMHLEGMTQEAETKLFYGNTNTDPEEFMGFGPRFNSLSAPNGNQIIDAGGTLSNNSSIWFVTWSDTTCHLLYPQGTVAGVKREDKGEQRVIDAAGNAYYVMEEKFIWHIGLAVRDPRYVARIANINMTNLAAGSVQLYNFMRKAYYALQNRRVPDGQQVIYCNTDVMEALDALATNAGADDSFVRLRPMEIQGEEVLSYRGIPIRETDALINTEARVV